MRFRISRRCIAHNKRRNVEFVNIKMSKKLTMTVAFLLNSDGGKDDNSEYSPANNDGFVNKENYQNDKKLL